MQMAIDYLQKRNGSMHAGLVGQALLLMVPSLHWNVIMISTWIAWVGIVVILTKYGVKLGRSSSMVGDWQTCMEMSGSGAGMDILRITIYCHRLTLSGMQIPGRIAYCAGDVGKVWLNAVGLHVDMHTHPMLITAELDCVRPETQTNYQWGDM